MLRKILISCWTSLHMRFFLFGMCFLEIFCQFDNDRQFRAFHNAIAIFLHVIFDFYILQAVAWSILKQPSEHRQPRPLVSGISPKTFAIQRMFLRLLFFLVVFSVLLT